MRGWFRSVVLMALAALVAAVFQSCGEGSKVAEPANTAPVKATLDPLTGAPRDGSTGQSIRPVLAWRCSDPDGDPLTFDIYLGEDPNPPIFLNSRITSCAVSSPLAYATTYYWRVVASDGHGNSTSSDVWSFTTQVAELECDASAEPTIGFPPLQVSFAGSAQYGQPPYSYYWVFGDDSTSTEQNPTHDYLLKGTYSAVLKVKDSLENTCSKALTIIVEGPPDCEGLASTTFGPPPLVINFVGDASNGQPPYTYHWDFGDGTSSDLREASHTYLLEGDYEAVMTVTDSKARFCTQVFHITVGPPLTCSGAANPPAGYVPLVVEFTASALGGRPPYTFVWNFGDGQSLSDQNPRHTYVSQGTFTAVLTVIDSRQATCTKSMRILVLR